VASYNIVSAASMAAGQPEDISVILANFSAIQSVLNGNLDNGNIAAGAALAASKLAPGTDGQYLKTVGTTPVWAADTYPQCKVAHSVNQAVPTGVWTSLAFDTETNDPQNMHDPVTLNSRITIPVTGSYLFGGTIAFDVGAAGTVRGVDIYLVNVVIPIARLIIPTLANAELTVVGFLPNIANGNVLELRAYQDSGAPLNAVVVAGYAPRFWCVRTDA
jgi:hypothetical protein